MKGIEQMLIGQLPNLRETQAGKELIAIGKQEGREQGELIGQVRALQEILGFEPTESEVLAGLSIDVLTSRVAELRVELQKRR